MSAKGNRMAIVVGGHLFQGFAADVALAIAEAWAKSVGWSVRAMPYEPEFRSKLLDALGDETLHVKELAARLKRPLQSVDTQCRDYVRKGWLERAGRRCFRKGRLEEPVPGVYRRVRP
jgi:predicted Rossmann fold nucleotide-binding protein DprA/Smf involved in DNA uptake